MIKKDEQRVSAIAAKSFAQYIAFGPYAFHTALTMRDTGLLAALDKAGEDGASVARLAEETGLSEYGVSVLIDFAGNMGVVEARDEHYRLGAIGHFLLHDEMTRVNMNFTRDISYDALSHLTESIRTGRPAGLQTLGPWPTLYEGLTRLPEPAGTSWFEFDHYYSDRVFDQLLPIVFDKPPRHLLDVGGNTGRWALKCLAYDAEVHVTLMDLPRQLDKAKQNIESAEFGDRAHYHAANVFSEDTQIPTDVDTIWMSQFLDCFSEKEIVHILRRAADVMQDNSRLFIVELFPDQQNFDAARFCLDATSLYFTCVANGNSRMYHYQPFCELVAQAGLKIEHEQFLPAGGHTLLCCTKA